MKTRKKVLAALLVVSILMSLLPLIGAIPTNACDDRPGQPCNPSISLEKCGPGTAKAGETITYSFTVRNGEVPLQGVSVSDQMLGGTIKDLGDMGARASAGPFTATYTIPSGATGSVSNTATVTGYHDEKPVTGAGSWTVIIPPEIPKLVPAISLTKVATPKSVEECGTINYHLVVTNSGQLPLSNVTVTDPMFGGVIWGPGPLAVLQSVPIDKSIKLKPGQGFPNGIDNTATAVGYASPQRQLQCGEGGEGQKVTATATEHVDVFRPCPKISIKKTADSSTVEAGGTINYTIVVTNNGDVPLTNVHVKDGMLGIDKTYPLLMPKGTKTETGSHKAGLFECTVYNKATVEGTYGCQKVNDCSDVTVCVTKPKPSIEITKSGPQSACVGEVVTYSFTVTNTSKKVGLTNVIASDGRVGMLKCLGCMEPGETQEFSVKYKVQPWDPCLIVNTAAVTACSIYGPVSDTACHQMVVKKPSIDIEKCGPLYAYAGNTITYKFTVINNGNVPLDNVTVVDEKLDKTWGLGTLCPGVPVCFTADYTVQASDACVLMNVATVTADSCCGQVKDRACHKLLVKNPAIAIEKTGPETACVGDKITYKIKVTNTGNMPLFGLRIEDPTLNWVKVVCPILPLLPGQSVCYEIDYIVPEDVGNTIVNTATVTACSICGGKVEAQDDHTVKILKPSIEITKNGPATGCRGQEVTYTFTVKNTGNVDLENLKVTDSKIGDIGTIEFLGAGKTSDPLYGKYKITAEDDDPLKNTATVVVETPCGKTLTATADHTLDILKPEIDITKTGPSTATVGDQITYNFVVTNTGETPLDNVKVNDDVIGPIGGTDVTPLSLAIGESKPLTATYTIKADDPSPLKNTVTVTGDTPCKITVTDKADHSLTIVKVFEGASGIQVTKTLNDSDGKVMVGDTFNYDITVKNSGQTVILADVNLKDTYDTKYLSYQFGGPASDDNVDDGEINWKDISGGKGLNPGDSITVTVYFVAKISGDTENNAAVSAKDENEKLLEASDSDPVTIEARPLGTPTPAPVNPVTSTQTQQAASTTSSLPYTGDNLSVLIFMALSMMAAGPLFMLTDKVRRRKRGK